MENLYKIARKDGFSRGEAVALLATPIVTGLAPTAYVASQCDWANDPYKSIVLTSLSLVVVPFTLAAGFFGVIKGINYNRQRKIKKSIRSSNSFTERDKGLEGNLNSDSK